MGVELVGRKLGMTQIFDETGDRIAVTVVRTSPCTVVQKKTQEKDGYSALQLGFEERKEKHTTKPLRGHFEKASVSPKRVLYEVRVSAEELEGFELGQSLDCSSFEEGQMVDVSGTSKGRGFTGVIKRWGFSKHSQTHGTHEFFRHGGAISAGASPGKVLRGKKMAGHYGNERVTTQGLRIVRVDPERHLLFIRGAIPGHRDGVVRVRPSARAPRA
jgi:large subunit ribosomal protein L3